MTENPLKNGKFIDLLQYYRMDRLENLLEINSVKSKD